LDSRGHGSLSTHDPAGETLYGVNLGSIFVPGHGPVHQPKLHLTPTERHVWQFEPGQEIHILETDFGRMGVSICYDVQFPEVARIQAEQGVQLLVVPYLTDDWRGYTRVTTCARARGSVLNHQLPWLNRDPMSSPSVG